MATGQVISVATIEVFNQLQFVAVCSKASSWGAEGWLSTPQDGVQKLRAFSKNLSVDKAEHCDVPSGLQWSKSKM